MRRTKLHSLFFWAAFVPLGLAGIPTALFAAWGLVIAPFDQPGQPAPQWAIGAMLVFQTAGVVALGCMPFVRGAFTSSELEFVFPDGPGEWRKLCLSLGLICLTLFDVLACLATAIPGADPLWVFASPFYLTYLVLVWFALLGASTR